MNKDLQKFGEFYVDIRFDKFYLYPKEIQIGSSKYYRFMDFFFSHKPIIKLLSNEVIEICELRLKFADKVIDDIFYKVILDTINQHLRNHIDFHQPTSLLDFGCGDGKSILYIQKHILLHDAIGADISYKSIQIAISKGLKIVLIKDGFIPLSSNIFDVVTAIFVMHFSVSIRCLQEIHRVLKKDGIFTFNIYNNSDENNLIIRLVNIGFKVVKVENVNNSKHHIYILKKYKYDVLVLPREDV